MTVRTFWESTVGDPAYGSDTQRMLLEEDPAKAAAEAPIDVAEVLALLPEVSAGAHVLELGAGVGRFTEVLAPRAARLTACDLVLAFIEKNRAMCLERGFSQVDFVVADASQLELEPVDLIFMNWLLLYFDDPSARGFLRRCVEALRPGGHLFVRESCEDADAGLDTRYEPYLAEYPAYYRAPRWYTEALREATSGIAGTFVHDAVDLPLWNSGDGSNVQRAWLWRRDA